MNFTGLNSDMKITLEIILTLIKVERSSFILSKFRCFSIWTCHIFDTPLGTYRVIHTVLSGMVNMSQESSVVVTLLASVRTT